MGKYAIMYPFGQVKLAFLYPHKDNYNLVSCPCQGQKGIKLEANPYRIQVKPITVAPKTPLVVQGRDTFETPNYATDLLIPFIPKNIKRIWECAAGDRKITNRLIHWGYDTYSTDLRDAVSVNFLTWDLKDQYTYCDCIITNPPFSVKDMFIEKAFEYGVPFAFLINMDYSMQMCNWIRRGCQRIVPDRRIDFLTPTGRQGKNSSAQFHSGWLTYGFNLPSSEVIVELSLKSKKENI
jgi:hypothetical protein